MPCRITATVILSSMVALSAGCGDLFETDASARQRRDVESPLAGYQANLLPLVTPCSYAAKSGIVTVWMNPSEIANISKRSVDSALLIQGVTCDDTTGTVPVSAQTTKLKTINIGPDSTSGSKVDLGSTSEIIILDLSGGPIAPAGAAGGGIYVDLGGSNDQINVLGAKTAEKMGCTLCSGKECLGLASPTGTDVRITTYTGNAYTIDLSDGADSFDKGNCVTPMEIYGGAGADTFLVGSNTSQAGDHYHGGADIDTISYASRLTAIVAVADGTTPSGDPSGSGEQDVIEADIENIVGGAGDDRLVAAKDSKAKHSVNGGPGNDTLLSSVGSSTTLIGGPGVDTVDYSDRTTGIAATIGDNKANDGATGDADSIGADVENIVGSDFDDVIVGSPQSNIIAAGLGNDTVSGGDGDDTILASASSADGNDTIVGGKGNDTVDYSARTSGGVCVVLDGLTRSGACSFSIGNSTMNVSSSDSDLIGNDIETVVGTVGDDHLVGNSSGNYLIGLGGADWLEGRAGNDQLDTNIYMSAHGYICIPTTLACVTGSGSGSCDCASSVLTRSCSTTATIDCGGDPLDLGACMGADPSQFIDCWRTQ